MTTSDAHLFLDGLTKEVAHAFSSTQQLMGFAPFLELVHEAPRAHMRSAVQYLRDCMTHYGQYETSTGVQTDRFTLFDVPFDAGIGRMIGQEAAQRRVFQLLENFAHAGRVDKLILLHGPNGSAKSTFVKTLMHGLEDYSTLDEGALYCFNWVFPAEHITRAESIGFGSGAVRREDLHSFALLDNEHIDARLRCTTRDHPLLLIPLEARQRLIDSMEPRLGEDFVVGDVLYRGELSHTNRQIFDALLTAYKGDLGAVYKHIQVERFVISRRYRRGAITVEPQMRVDASVRQLTADRSLGALPPALQSLSLFDAVGDVVDANRGIIEYDDLFKRHPDLNKYLLSASERASVSLEDRNLFMDVVLLATCNEMYLDAFKQSPEYASFKGRIELVRLPYLLDYTQEKDVYDEHILRSELGKPSSPHTTLVAAMWAVLTRLKRPQEGAFAAPVEEVVQGLTPLEKADLYVTGRAPSRLSPEQGRALAGAVAQVMAQGQTGSHYEGRFGASPREMRMVLLNAAQRPGHQTLSPQAVFAQLEELVEDPSVYTFLQMKPDGLYVDHAALIDVVRERYLDLLDEEVRAAMGLVDASQYDALFRRYIDQARAWLKGERVRNEVTGQDEPADEAWMKKMEQDMRMKGEDPTRMRQALLSSIAAFSIDNPGDALAYHDIFPRQFEALSESFFEIRRAQVRDIQQDMLRLLEPDGHADGLDPAARQIAQAAIDALITVYLYPREGIREALALLVSKRY